MIPESLPRPDRTGRVKRLAAQTGEFFQKLLHGYPLWRCHLVGVQQVADAPVERPGLAKNVAMSSTLYAGGTFGLVRDSQDEMSGTLTDRLPSPLRAFASWSWFTFRPGQRSSRRARRRRARA